MPGVKVQRAESLRSERSDASLANKRVSFNNDVDVKHIQLGRHGNRLPTGTASLLNASFFLRLSFSLVNISLDFILFIFSFSLSLSLSLFFFSFFLFISLARTIKSSLNR